MLKSGRCPRRRSICGWPNTGGPSLRGPTIGPFLASLRSRRGRSCAAQADCHERSCPCLHSSCRHRLAAPQTQNQASARILCGLPSARSAHRHHGIPIRCSAMHCPPYKPKCYQMRLLPKASYYLQDKNNLQK